MSKAWYQQTKLPQLLARFTNTTASPSSPKKKVIEIWTTTCIVTNFGMQRDHHRRPSNGPSVETNNNGADNNSSDIHHTTGYLDQSPLPRCSTLINPANPQLTGPNSFPYFPRGGPQPESLPNRPAHHIMGYVSQWGGMDVGGGMLFSAAAIDGLVHQLGGLRLRAECSIVPIHPLSHLYVNQQTEKLISGKQIANNDDNKYCNNENTQNWNNHYNNNDAGKAKCPVGLAITTVPGGKELKSQYDRIIHTVPPFYDYPPSATEKLQQYFLRLGIEDNKESGRQANLMNKDKHAWSRELLRSCYRHSFQLCFPDAVDNDDDECNEGFFDRIFSKIRSLTSSPSSSSFATLSPENQRVAVPLLGSGCRGFPVEVALEVAAVESVSWLTSNGSDVTTVNVGIPNRGDCDEHNDDDEMVIAFGLLEDADANSLASKIDKCLANMK